MLKKNYKTALRASAIIFLSLIVGTLARAYFKQPGAVNPAKTPVIFSGPYKEQYQLWSDEIDNKGPQQAYEDFLEKMKSVDFNLQHTYAHIFGETLYNKLGLNGFAY